MMVVNNRWFETGMPPSRGVKWRTGWPCLRRGWRIKLKTMSRLQLSVERQESKNPMFLKCMVLPSCSSNEMVRK